MKFYSFFFSILALTLLSSCGGAGKSKAKLEITQSFALGGANGGGTIVVASHSSGKKISIALDSDLQKTVTLEKGVWTFTVVGWDGDGMGNKLRGIKSCGTTTADLNSDAATVEIIANSSNCTTMAPTLAFKELAVSSCGIFKTYTPSNNTFQDFTAPIPASFCSTAGSMPFDYLSSYTHYRVFSVNHYNNSTSLGFSTSCLTASATASALDFPTQIIPFTIRTYKSATECNNLVGNSQMFEFKDGLAPGNPSDFEHKFADVNASTADFLVLPSSFTRRGSSPFMEEIPRVLCGTVANQQDCVAEPAPADNFYVRWHSKQANGGGNSKVIARNVASNFCSNSLFPTLYKFNFENCSVDNGNLKGHFSKNELLCPGTETEDQMWDITEKNNHFYLLTRNRVAMFTTKGTLVASINLGSSQPYRKIVVNPATGDIFLTSGTGISRATWNNSTKNFSPLNPLSGLIGMTVNELEVINGFLFVAGVDAGPTYNMKIYSTNGTFVANGQPYSFGGPIVLKQLIYVNDPVFSIASSLKLLYTDGTSSYIKSYPVDLTIPSMGSVISQATYAGTVESFWYNPGNFFVTTSAGFQRTDPNFTTLNNKTFTTSPKGIVALNNMQLFFIKNDGYLVGGTFDTSMDPIAPLQIDLGNPNVCTNSSTPFGALPSISVHSQRDEAVHHLTEDALDMFGRRSFLPNSKAFSYFDRLGNDGEDDDTRTGGKLGRVQQMLSPLGIGSLFSDKANCAALVSDTQAAGGSLSRSRRLYNNQKTEWMDVAVTAITYSTVNPAATIPLKYCVAGDPANTSSTCPAPTPTVSFDLKLEFTGTDIDGYKEKTHMKIKCGAKVGSLESVENDSGDIRREFYIYNTGDINNSRYEEYTRRDEDNKTDVSMSKILKFPTGNFMGRTVQATMEFDPILLAVGKTEGRSTEVHHVLGAPDRLKTVSYNISDSTLVLFEASGHAGDFDTIRNSNESSSILGASDAPGCKSALATDPRAISITPCSGVPSLSAADSDTAFGIPLAISEIIRAKDPTHEFNINSTGIRIFTIPAP